MITVALPNSVEWFIAFAACWKIGAVPQPVSARLPARELEAILELADPSVVIGVPPGAGRRPPDAAHRVPARSRSARRSPPRRHLAGMEGTDLRAGRRDDPKLIVSGDPALCDPDAPPLFGKADGCMVVPAPLYHNGPDRLVVLGLVGGQPRRRPSPFRRRGHAGGDRPLPGRHRVPGAHHDEADLAAARRGTRLLRPVLARVRLASGRAVPALAQGGLDRLARGGPHLRALRRDRGAGGDDHHRDRMARPPRFGRPADTGHRHDLRRRGERAGGGARGRGLVAHRARAADLPLHRRLSPTARRGMGVARRRGMARRGQLPVPG